MHSEKFGILNSTRQGSMLQLPIFSVYIDEILKELRKMGIGCRVAGVWKVADGFVDDLLLMAPGKSGMQNMLQMCKNYANSHNLKFSTDLNPAKSKPSVFV